MALGILFLSVSRGVVIYIPASKALDNDLDFCITSDVLWQWSAVAHPLLHVIVFNLS